VKIVNTFDGPVTLLTWNSPLEENTDVFHAELFDVTSRYGQEPMYIGILAKKNPVPTDFITLQKGESVNNTLDLHNGYWFRTAGDYSVTLNTVVRIVIGDYDLSNFSANVLADFHYELMTSNTITVSVKTLYPHSWPKLEAPLFPGLAGPAPDSSCTTNEGSTIRTAGNNAISATQQGIRYLQPSSCSSSLTTYVEWFGACDSSRYSTVKSNLNAIAGNVGLNGNYPVNCKGSSCNANTYAYVYPSWSNHTVFVCGYFWNVPTRNCVMDSQPGTLIHEMSHFNNVASTNDAAYGLTNCRNLARNNPAAAIRNADNYCFYTDSCPS